MIIGSCLGTNSSFSSFKMFFKASEVAFSSTSFFFKIKWKWNGRYMHHLGDLVSIEGKTKEWSSLTSTECLRSKILVTPIFLK